MQLGSILHEEIRRACDLHISISTQSETTNVSASIEKLLHETFPATAPGAAVLVVQKDAILVRKGFGQANLELGVPIDPAQVFRIGSMTKQFTAVAILQLVEAGKLKLDDDFSAYVPDFPTGGRKITITHLLTHTSGLPSYTDEKAWLTTWRQGLSLNELLAFTKDKPLKFAPGSNCAASVGMSEWDRELSYFSPPKEKQHEQKTTT